MNQLIVVSITCLAILGSDIFASDIEDQPANSTERFVLITPNGPIVVEATLTLDGRPFHTIREQLVTEVLKAADTDGDGKSTWREALDNPNSMSGSEGPFSPRKKEHYIDRYDNDHDGIVDRGEARAFVAGFSSGPAFQVLPFGYRFDEPDLATILDTDGDGDLTIDETAAAGLQLKNMDTNGDEILTAFEIAGPVRTWYRSRIETSARVRAVVAHGLGPTANLKEMYRTFGLKYGKKTHAPRFVDWPEIRKYLLSLDLNQNGQLDASEAAGFNTLKPHVELAINVSSDPSSQPGVSLKRTSADLSSQKVQTGSGNSIVLRLGRLTVRFGALPITRQPDDTWTVLALLRQFDRDKNGYLDMADVELLGESRRVQWQLKRWDRNNDGKVTSAEIKASLERQRLPRKGQVSVILAERPPSLFAAIDMNGDGVIGYREIQIAPSRLKSLDKDGDGQIGIGELPIEVSVWFVSGASHWRARRGYRPLSGEAFPRMIFTGPKWFVAMDRNRDGDVSLREFLGTSKMFRKLDRNDDGFIEPSEANSFPGSGTPDK